MENFFKEKLSKCVNYFKKRMESKPHEGYQLVETKRNIFYFSKFSLDINELCQISIYAKTLKENMFKNLLDTIRYCSKELVKFPNQHLTEKEKSLTIFTICYLHFYSHFSYDSLFTFEEYFSQDLINLCTKYNVTVRDIKQFKIFCYAFYYQIIKEIKMKGMNYSLYKGLYEYYNPTALEEENLLLAKDVEAEESKKMNIVQYLKNYVTRIYTKFNYYSPFKSNMKEIVNRKIMTPLISTTERIVDMVLSIDPEQSQAKISEDKCIEYENNDQEKPDMDISDVTFSLEAKTCIDNTHTASSCQQVVSKRILCELIKSDIDETKQEIVDDISKKLDMLLLDVILNKCENKIHIVQSFMCYIVEFNSDLIKILPDYQNLSDNINMRFIITAKNLYNYAVEVYFAIHDLANIDIATIVDVIRRKFPSHFDEKFCKCVLYFFKIITEELLTGYEDQSESTMMTLFEIVLKKLFQCWQSCILEKGKELTRFCKI